MKCYLQGNGSDDGGPLRPLSVTIAAKLPRRLADHLLRDYDRRIAVLWAKFREHEESECRPGSPTADTAESGGAAS